MFNFSQLYRLFELIFLTLTSDVALHMMYLWKALWPVSHGKTCLKWERAVELKDSTTIQSYLFTHQHDFTATIFNNSASF